MPEYFSNTISRERTRGLSCACVAGFAFSANYTNHAPLLGRLMPQFGFTQTYAGLLTTGIFVTHALMQVPGGHLVDRFGARRLMIASLAIVCAGNFAIAYSAAWWHLMFWKIFVGLGTGASFVAGARYIGELFAGARRLHFAQGLFGGSILLGSGFVILAIPRLLLTMSWRGAFFVTAAVASGAWLVWLIAAPRVPAVVHPPTAFLTMLLARQLWLLGIVQMASFGLAMIAGTWIIALLRHIPGVTAVQAGLAGSAVLLLGIVMRPLGGIFVPHLGVRTVLLVSLAVNAAGCFALAEATSLSGAIAGISLLGAGCGLPYAALFTTAAARFPGRAGAAMGLVNMLGIMMILVGAPVVGAIADATGSFRSSFLALGAFSAAAIAAAVLIRSHEPHRSV